MSSRLSRLATAPGLHHVFSNAHFLTFKPEDQAKLLSLLPEEDRHNPEACLRSEQLVSAVRSRTEQPLSPLPSPWPYPWPSTRTPTLALASTLILTH